MSSLAVFAQDPGYHTEFSDGTSGWVIFVNDSQKPIEAFNIRATCGKFMSTGYTHDVFDSGAVGSSHPVLGGIQMSLIQPGQRFFTLPKLSQQSGCEWKLQVGGAIYADGTYEGEESAIRNLQARRDGISAALQYWTKLHNDAQEGTDEEIVYAGAEELSKEDTGKTATLPGCPDQSAVCAYWWGRLQVDVNVAQHLKINQSKAHPMLVSRFVERWTEKVDADEAFKKLEETFPTPQ